MQLHYGYETATIFADARERHMTDQRLRVPRVRLESHIDNRKRNKPNKRARLVAQAFKGNRYARTIAFKGAA